MFIILIMVMDLWVCTDVKLYTLSMCSLLSFSGTPVKLYKKGASACSVSPHETSGGCLSLAYHIIPSP